MRALMALMALFGAGHRSLDMAGGNLGLRKSWLAEILILVCCFSDEDPGLDSTVCQVATKAFIPWQGPLISNDKIKLSHLYR